MRRLVVRLAGEIEEDGRETVKFFLDQGPVGVADPGRLYRLTCRSDTVLELFNRTPPDAEGVRKVGEMLLQELTAHPGVRQALDVALTDGSGAPWPIYLRLGSDEAAVLPWETLFHERSSFLALDGRWPIARISDLLPQEQDMRYFDPPLNLTVVLSAAGVDARPQWEHLRDAVLGAPLDVRLRAVIGDGALHSAAGAEVRQLGDPRLAVAPLAGKAELLAEIQASDPHILHVFSHGRGDYSPRLELATARDHVLGRSSVIVEPGELRGIAPNAWLVVLNCCRGGADTADSRSLAHRVVGAGYPAAIGMREPITDTDGHLVTRSFYPGLLARLAELLTPGSVAELDWSADLHRPRQQLRDKYLDSVTADEAVGPSQLAARYRDWAVPVLYVRPEPLTVETVEVNPALSPDRRTYLLTLLQQTSRIRLNLHAATPAAALAEIDRRIERTKRELRRRR